MRTRIAFSTVLLLGMIVFLGCEKSVLNSPTDSPGSDAGAISPLAKGKPPGNGKPQPDPSITVEFLDAEPDNIRSDGRGIYEDGVCNVDATFNLNDARLSLKGKIRKQDQAACGEPRFIEVQFTDRVEGSPLRTELDGTFKEAGFMKVNEVETVTLEDGWVERTAVLHLPGCAHGLKFNPNNDPNSDFVLIMKNPDGTWTVKTKDSPDNVAVCIPDEDRKNSPPRTYYYMPFEITVSLK